MPRLEIQLLGPPRIVIDGQPGRSPRGAKAWAMLAFLLLSRTHVTREHLAALLFADADDPLGALRWNLAEVRRALPEDVSLVGDPVSIELPADAVVDVHVLGSATWLEATRVPGLGHELLEGIDVRADAAFEAWLLAERRHVGGLSAAILREAATARLASGSADQAVDLATRLVAFDEFDEEAHALLARAYVAAGAVPEAREHVAAAAARIRRELHTEPTATLLDAVESALASPAPGPLWVRSTGSVESLITAGDAAVSAGVLEPGIDILRRAVVDAREVGDRLLEARALVALGTAFIHGARGRDGEGAKALHAAVAMGREIGAPAISSEASRELGYVELKQARYERAAAWLDQAIALAPDRDTAASAMAILGAVHTDQGATDVGSGLLARAASDARDLDKPRLEAWALAFLGRVRLLREEWDAARVSLTRSIELAKAARWVAFLPFPQSLLATVDLGVGRVDDARAAFETAFALGCQIGDPCWEGLAARGVGIVHWKDGRIDEAIAWLDDARTRCVRIPDSYLWVQAFCLDALCDVGIASGDPRAGGWVTDLEILAARSGMYEMLVRADLHRAAMGDRHAGEAARLFASRIDNPAVLARVAPSAPASRQPAEWLAQPNSVR